MITLVKRPNNSALFSALSPFIALGVTLLAGAIIFAASGQNPIKALYTYFVEPLSEMWSIHELLIKAAPLILIAVGLSVAYHSNNWNIGAEGQFIAGALMGSIPPLMFPEWQSVLTLPTMLVLGLMGGALYGAIPALLKVKFNTNEILTSLMLVYIVQLFLDWMVRGPWRNPEGNNFPETRRFHPDAVLPELFSASGRANWGIVIAIVVAVLIWFMMARTKRGFEVRVQGASPRAARFGGVNASRMVFFAFMLSGALAGLAGIMEVAGAIGQLRPSISPGYGFAAIIVAFLGRLNPLGIIAAGLVLALTYLGGEAAQISLGLSDKLARVFQGILLFSVLACDTLIHYRIMLGTGTPETGRAA
ncbi:MAG: ABC transporter permease [Rhizobiaceae bacterium]